MGYTPYGYRIENGAAAINDQEAGCVRRIFDNYISGMSLREAAIAAGHPLVHSAVKRMLTKKYYCGDDFYPAMDAVEDSLTITLEAVCDSFSSLLWDIEYYQCGSFEVYIAANPENLAIFQTGRIVGRDDDSQHFGIIESVQIDTDAENDDYLTVRGRFVLYCELIFIACCSIIVLK